MSDSFKIAWWMDCEMAASVIDRSQHHDIGWKGRIALSLHLFICQDCRNYYEQSKLLTAITKKISSVDIFVDDVNVLSDSKKDEMKHAIEMELRKKD